MQAVTAVYRGGLDTLTVDELVRRLEHVSASLELELEIHYENMLADDLVVADEPTRSGGPGVLLVGAPRPEGEGVRAIALAGLEAHSPGADTPAPSSRRAELDEPVAEPARADWRDVGLHRIEPPPRFAVLDWHGRTPLAIVDAETPLGALDAYADLECIARYSESDELDDGLVYVHEGMLGAVFSNYEIAAYPIAYPLEKVGPGQNGYALVDADEHYVADGLSSDEADAILGGGSWHGAGS